MFYLPDIVVSMILKYLSRNELLLIRLVCKSALYAATREISSRRDTVLLRCCTKNESIRALSAVFKNVSQVLYEHNVHSGCDNGRSTLFTAKEAFPNVFHLAVLSQIGTRLPVRTSALLFRQTFSHITRLQFVMVMLNEKELCAALRGWNTLKSVAIYKCIGVHLRWLTALTQNIEAVVAKEHGYCTKPCTTFYKLLPSILSVVIPKVKYFAISASCKCRRKCCLNKFNVYKFIESLKELSVLRLKVSNSKFLQPYIRCSTLRKLRLHLEDLSCTRFQLRECVCESLQILELKFTTKQPSQATLKNLYSSFSNTVRHLTLTAHYIVFNADIYETLAHFRLLKVFAFRDKNFSLTLDGNENYDLNQAHNNQDGAKDFIMQYLQYACTANDVQMYLQFNQNRQTNIQTFSTFLAQLLEIASIRRNVTYKIFLTQSFGCYVLPENVRLTEKCQTYKLIDVWSEGTSYKRKLPKLI